MEKENPTAGASSPNAPEQRVIASPLAELTPQLGSEDCGHDSGVVFHIIHFGEIIHNRGRTSRRGTRQAAPGHPMQCWTQHC